MLKRNRLQTQRQKFHTDLIRYLNGGTVSRLDSLVSGIAMDVALKRNAHRIIQQRQCAVETLNSKGNVSLDIGVESYKGANIHVLKMMAYLSEYLQDELVGAYVHGSLGTYEEISYSDFDALVIVQNRVFASAQKLTKFAKSLSSARSIMYEFDPLQHHGWFVLSEKDLDNYPQYYFPVELFKYSKSLLPDKGLELKVTLKNPDEKAVESSDSFSNSPLCQ